MNKRPLSVTVTGWLFIAAGVMGLCAHAAEFKAAATFKSDLVWVFLVRALAVVGGAFLLRGANWARWFLMAWMVYHVLLSVVHSALQLIVHGLLCAIIAYLLFRRPAAAYFQNRKARQVPSTPTGALG